MKAPASFGARAGHHGLETSFDKQNAAFVDCGPLNGTEYPKEMKPVMIQTPDASDIPLTHPEEMRAGFDLRIGKNINLKGTARITPAGVVCAGIASVAILLAATALVRATRR
jgi:hypothetical protein